MSITAETSASNVGRVLTQRVDWVAWTSIELNGARDVIILTCSTSSVLHPSKRGCTCGLEISSAPYSGSYRKSHILPHAFIRVRNFDCAQPPLGIMV